MRRGFFPRGVKACTDCRKKGGTWPNRCSECGAPCCTHVCPSTEPPEEMACFPCRRKQGAGDDKCVESKSGSEEPSAAVDAKI